MRRAVMIGLLALLSLTGLSADDAGQVPEKGSFVFFKRSIRWVFKPPFMATVGVAALSADALVMSSVQECQGLGYCPVMLAACQPAVLDKQSKGKTVIAHGNWKASYSGDLRPETFADRMECEIAAGIEPTGVTGLIFGRDLVLLRVVPGGPAELAGITAGRKILRAAGKPVSSMDELTAALDGIPGTEVEIVLGKGDSETSYLLTRKPWSEVFTRPGDAIP